MLPSIKTAAAGGLQRRRLVTPAQPKLNLDVWSDVACPWCYVGKKRLDRAIKLFQAKYPGAQVDINWHPFIIDPKVHTEGEDYLAYNQRRWGSDEWTKQLRKSGAPDGAPFADWRSWPNTLRAHELIFMAAEQGKAQQAIELLFRRTYEQGGNVSQLHELEAVGRSLGLLDVPHHIQAGTYRPAVAAEDRAAKKELNITGVPYLILGAPGAPSYAVSGAQRTERLLSMFDLALQKAHEAATVTSMGGESVDLQAQQSTAQPSVAPATA